MVSRTLILAGCRPDTRLQGWEQTADLVGSFEGQVRLVLITQMGRRSQPLRDASNLLPLFFLPHRNFLTFGLWLHKDTLLALFDVVLRGGCLEQRG